MDNETPYKPPLRSRATRSFAARSKSSVRGFLIANLPAQDHPRQIIYESTLERRVLLTFLARRDVMDIWDQPPAIQYVNGAGVTKRHTPDFLMTFQTGQRIAIAVKPLAAVERLRFREELMLVRRALSPVYAGGLWLLTDADLNDADVRSAKLLHIARQTVDEEPRQVIGAILVNLKSGSTVANIVAQSGLAGRGWAALICVTFEGEARIGAGHKLSNKSILYPRGKQ